MFGFAGKLVTLALLSTQSCTFAYQVPTLDYAFTITSFNQAIGSPIALQGYNQTGEQPIDSSLCGPASRLILIVHSRDRCKLDHQRPSSQRDPCHPILHRAGLQYLGQW